MQSDGHSRFTALSLLVVFLVGGLLGPAMHRVQHAEAEHARQQAENARCEGHGPHTGPSVETVLSSLDEAPCLLCVRTLTGLDVPFALAAPAPLPTAILSAPSEAVARSGPALSLLIRGPPAYS